MADNTASLVVALSAQLTKFEKDMRAAGIMADKAVNDIEDRFSKMNPKISTSFFGNLFANLADKAMSGAVAAIETLIDRFVELQKVSRYTELSMNWIYGLQAAGEKAGAGIGDVNTALKSIAFLLDEMKRGGDNPLKTLLDANPQFLKGANRDALSLTQTLGIVQDILAQAKNTIQAVDIGKNLGIPESVIAGWQKGSQAVNDTAAAAAKAAPDLQKLADQAKLVADTWELVKKSFTDSMLKGFFDNLITDVQLLKSIMEGLLPLFDKIGLGDRAKASIEELKSAAASIQAAREGKSADGERPLTRVPVSGGTAVDPFARKATAAAEASDFDRATKSIEKHTTAMQAEGATVFESAHAQEEYRVQLLLTEALTNDGKEINEKYADSIATIAERAATAKQKLAEQQFQLQRLNSASQQVGSALSTAFADAIVEGKSLNDVMSSLIKTLEKAAINSLVMSFFTPGAGGGLSPFAALFKAGGGPVSAGHPYIVGEKGPEFFVPNQNGQVVPNDVVRSSAGAGGAVVYSPSIDARGASVEAVTKLAQIMEADRAAFASRTIAVIQQARRGRVVGV